MTRWSENRLQFMETLWRIMHHDFNICVVWLWPQWIWPLVSFLHIYLICCVRKTDVTFSEEGLTVYFVFVLGYVGIRTFAISALYHGTLLGMRSWALAVGHNVWGNLTLTLNIPPDNSDTTPPAETNAALHRDRISTMLLSIVVPHVHYENKVR